ncbi:MAG: class I tRNA ligase family protein [Candidatus Pacearchaeota archaeon]|nr:class I tRNA ligase family protein [Candidatus Pacearchaeota archaeon]MDE1848683.1 class I tRNA ligase family protein [Nanoarchaeota archaeon]
MKQRIIANPPLGIYTNAKTHIGHAFFLVLLDVVSRYRRKFKGQESIFPGRSYNFYGRRGDLLLKDSGSGINSAEDLEIANLNTVYSDTVRGMLNLSSLDLLTDTDKNVGEGVSEDFKELYESGYIKRINGSYFLSPADIKSHSDLQGFIKGIKLHPSRIEGELERMIRENTSNLIQISKPTGYSLKNPLRGQNIGPLFVLANLWDHKYPESDYTIAGSNSVMTKYIFLRILCRSALESSPGMDEIIIWPKIIPEGGISEWDLKEIIKDEYHSDMIRYLLLSSYSESKQKVFLEKNKLKSARNFVYLVANMRKPFKGIASSQQKPSESYIKDMDNFDFPKVLAELNQEFRRISNKINHYRDNKDWTDSNKEILGKEYLKAVNMSEPITPSTAKLVNDYLR